MTTPDVADGDDGDGAGAVALAYGVGRRMLTIEQVCEWFNVTERHVRKLVEREAIPYRKVGRLLRFAEHELDLWSRPAPRPARTTDHESDPESRHELHVSPRGRSNSWLPKSLIE